MEGKEEISYWIGVIVGFISSLIIVVVALFIFNSKLIKMQTQLNNIEEVQADQSEWISENETVMRTYKFFNETWRAIIDQDVKNKEE
jgi:formate-dependent nitrite reductase membrane component NrfD